MHALVSRKKIKAQPEEHLRRSGAEGAFPALNPQVPRRAQSTYRAIDDLELVRVFLAPNWTLIHHIPRRQR